MPVTSLKSLVTNDCHAVFHTQETTLGEFLQAVESVKRKEEQEEAGQEHAGDSRRQGRRNTTDSIRVVVGEEGVGKGRLNPCIH